MEQLVSKRRIHALTGISWPELQLLSHCAQSRYDSFDMYLPRNSPEGRAKWRHIDNPKPELKRAQRRVLRGVLESFRLPGRMFGARRGGSVLDHASLHEGQECILTLDLRSCFPRTSQRQVFRALCANYRCSEDIAAMLTRLTTLRHRLPQGAPTSGYLAHLALLPLYLELEHLARAHRLKLSFFMDDIAISGPRSAVAAIVEKAIRTIQKHGHSVPIHKKHFMTGDDREVTKLLVREVVAIRPSYLERLELEIMLACRAGRITAREYRSLTGKLVWIERVSPGKASHMEEMVRMLPVAGPGRKPPARSLPCAGGADCNARARQRMPSTRSSII